MAIQYPDRSSVDEFSVLADKPVVLVREFFIDLAPFINDVVAMCPQFTNELRESFHAIPRPLTKGSCSVTSGYPEVIEIRMCRLNP